MREEQGATEQRQREQRASDMNKLADQFEGVVGQIIGAVSTASTKLEASAGVLSTHCGGGRESQPPRGERIE